MVVFSGLVWWSSTLTVAALSDPKLLACVFVWEVSGERVLVAC